MAAAWLLAEPSSWVHWLHPPPPHGILLGSHGGTNIHHPRVYICCDQKPTVTGKFLACRTQALHGPKRTALRGLWNRSFPTHCIIAFAVAGHVSEKARL